MIHVLIKYELDMDPVIHGVSSNISKFFLSNYSLTSQLIIVNLFTAVTGLIFLLLFNYIIISKDRSIELKINENNQHINKISNYLKESAILRVRIFNEDCEKNLEKTIAKCEELELSDPQLDPSITQKYLIQNFLDEDFTVIIYDKLERLFADTENMYKSSEVIEVIEIDPKERLRNLSFYTQYKNFYLDFYKNVQFYFIKKKYQYFTNEFTNNDYINQNIFEETVENELLVSKLYFDIENNLIQKLSSIIVKENITYGVILITSILNQDNRDQGVNSFNLINLYFIIIFIMFLSSLFFSRSIVFPIKLLSKITQIERNKSSLNKQIIHYPNRGDEIGILGNDIKNMSEDLKKRIKEIEEFAADVSHELKNPLSNLKSSSDLLAKNKIDQKNKELLLKNMSNDVDRMNILISDISNYTITQVQISEELFEKINLSDFLNEFLNSLSEKKSLIKIQLTQNNIFINVNKNKFIQVLHNLLDNSFSYGEINSKILIDVVKDKQQCFIYFIDQGPGISLNYGEKIFQRFYTDRDNLRNHHTGLGLTIARNIINSFGGSLQLVKKTYSGFDGACFEINLPLKD